jgi:hypothetical protein
MRHGPHRNRCVQKLFYSCVCIRCPGNVFADPLPSNKGGTQTHRYQGAPTTVLLFLAYFLHFEKREVSLSDHRAVCVCILSLDSVTIEGVRIGYRIYWTPKDRNYK